MFGFGEFGKKRKLGINSTSDIRLVCIDPTASEDFYGNVLGYVTDDKNINDFINGIKEVKNAGIGPFWRPIYDPSLDGNAVVFEAGCIPATGYSYNFWKMKTAEMPAVEGNLWELGTEYQYYAFLTWLINQLVANGRNISEAIKIPLKSCTDHCFLYFHEYRTTGGTNVCGVYDLANTYKLLACSNEEVGGFWIAGGGDMCELGDHPLADLRHINDVYRNERYQDGVGWFVLNPPRDFQ